MFTFLHDVEDDGCTIGTHKRTHPSNNLTWSKVFCFIEHLQVLIAPFQSHSSTTKEQQISREVYETTLPSVGRTTQKKQRYLRQWRIVVLRVCQQTFIPPWQHRPFAKGESAAAVETAIRRRFHGAPRPPQLTTGFEDDRGGKKVLWSMHLPTLQNVVRRGHPLSNTQVNIFRVNRTKDHYSESRQPYSRKTVVASDVDTRSAFDQTVWTIDATFVPCQPGRATRLSCVRSAIVDLETDFSALSRAELRANPFHPASRE